MRSCARSCRGDVELIHVQAHRKRISSHIPVVRLRLHVLSDEMTKGHTDLTLLAHSQLVSCSCGCMFRLMCVLVKFTEREKSRYSIMTPTVWLLGRRCALTAEQLCACCVQRNIDCRQARAAFHGVPLCRADVIIVSPTETYTRPCSKDLLWHELRLAVFQKS